MASRDWDAAMAAMAAGAQVLDLSGYGLVAADAVLLMEALTLNTSMKSVDLSGE
jgi:hypothetical protein